MANYKRRKCRANAIHAKRGSETSRRARAGIKPVRPKPGLARWEDDEYWEAGRTYRRWSWLHHWPAWWDRVFHTRPKRVAIKRLERKILRDEVDPDDLSWPLGNRKPHNYYW